MNKRSLASGASRKKGFTGVSSVLEKYNVQEDKYINREFQQYGYDLAVELNDLRHKALYIKLAKTENRGFMERARSFVKDAHDVKSPGRLFMWKLKQLKNEKQKK